MRICRRIGDLVAFFTGRTRSGGAAAAAGLTMCRKSKKAASRGEHLGLTEDEVLSCDALASNESGVRELTLAWPMAALAGFNLTLCAPCPTAGLMKRVCLVDHAQPQWAEHEAHGQKTGWRRVAAIAPSTSVARARHVYSTTCHRTNDTNIGRTTGCAMTPKRKFR